MALSFNPEVKNEIISNGSTVIYSSGNIIIASEISEELFNELRKSPYVDSITELPLKRFGNLSSVNEIVEQENINQFNGTNGSSSTSGTSGTSGGGGGGNVSGNASLA